MVPYNQKKPIFTLYLKSRTSHKHSFSWYCLHYNNKKSVHLFYVHTSKKMYTFFKHSTLSQWRSPLLAFFYFWSVLFIITLLAQKNKKKKEFPISDQNSKFKLWHIEFGHAILSLYFLRSDRVLFSARS